MKMSWKRWRIGLLVATITGVCTAFTVGLVIPTMTLKEGSFILFASIAKDLLLFLKDHPIESVEDSVAIEIKKL